MRRLNQNNSLLSLVSSLLIGTALAGCASLDLDSDMPKAYQSRHPIELTGSIESTTVQVSVAGASVNALQRSEIEAFARAFRTDGEGAVAVNIPVGAPNEAQAGNVARDVRTILTNTGLPQQAVVYRPYKAGPGAMSPPVLLSYSRVKANVASPCGQIDDVDIDYRNLPYQDFGCATQTNFAAMIANPSDLVSPRPLDRASSTRRTQVIDKYNQGTSTSVGPLQSSTTAGGSGG